MFECAVATAVAFSAIGALNAERHKFSFGQGGKAIVNERRRPGKKGDALFIGGKNTNYFFKLAGQSGYFDAQQEFDRRPRPTVTFEVSRRALLRATNASVGGKNIVRLTRALRRLLEPVRIDKGQFPPLLAAVEHLPNGRLRLAVDGRWLPRRLFGKVPLPVPTRGNCSNGLALYLFLCGSDQRARSVTDIRVTELCARCGMVTRWRGDARQAIERALKAVNNHLRDLNRAGELLAENLPTKFEPKFLKGDRVRFLAHHGEDVEGDEPDASAEAVNFDLPADAVNDDKPVAEPTEAEIRRWLALTDEEQQRELAHSERERDLSGIKRTKGDWAAFRERLAGT